MLNSIILETDSETVKQLSDFFENYPEIRITDTFKDINELESTPFSQTPDLAFISWTFMDANPFLIANLLSDHFGQIPAIIFIGDSAEDAWEALEAGAIDFLLRPLKSPRLYNCLYKILQLSINLETAGVIQSILQTPTSSTKRAYLRQLMVKDGNDILFVDSHDIHWMESSRNYVKLHLGHNNYLFRGTLQNLEMRLDPDHFVRIHRSYLVNRSQILKLQSWSNGDYVLFLKDRTELMLSRKYRHNIFANPSLQDGPALLQKSALNRVRVNSNQDSAATTP